MPIDATPNAFLLLRTVFFALLMYVHALALVFTSWNIAATKSAGMSAPGASVFLVVNSVCVLLLVPMAYLAEVICARARPGHVRVECAWTVLMSTFQLVVSVCVTINGPPTYCHAQWSWAVCASSALVVQISWLGTLVILSYCLTIGVAAATHAAHLPGVWTTPVTRVPWFQSEAPPPLPTHKKAASSSSSSSWSDTSCALSNYIAARWDKLRAERASGPILFTRGGQASVDGSRPAWARQQPVRRGVDHPFARRVLRKAPPPPLALPPLPMKTHARDVPSWYSQASARPAFPQRVGNPDLPVPRTRLTEWVRADGAAVHSDPHDLV